MGSKGLIRSRWAAIGAAVAVTLGGGGLIGVSAASGDASSLKTVTPTRIMDTRQGTDGKVSGKTVALQVTGEVTTYASDGTTPAATVVPTGANAVSLNLTVTQGERNQGYGFVTAFPCTAVTDQVPNASTLNFVEGVDVANSTVVPLGSTGMICLNVYGSAHLIVDANGYYETATSGAGAVDAYTKAESDATESEINAAIDLKADVGASYTKAESDATEAELQASIDSKLPESEYLNPEDGYSRSIAPFNMVASHYLGGCVATEAGHSANTLYSAGDAFSDPAYSNGEAEFWVPGNGDDGCEIMVDISPPHIGGVLNRGKLYPSTVAVCRSVDTSGSGSDVEMVNTQIFGYNSDYTENTNVVGTYIDPPLKNNSCSLWIASDAPATEHDGYSLKIPVSASTAGGLSSDSIRFHAVYVYYSDF